MDCTTSTSFISGTGLKKCSPSTCPGRLVAAAIAVTLHDEVFEASSACGRQMASSLTKVSFLSAWFSVIASMTRSQSLRSSSWVDPLRRPSVCSLTRSSILAFATSASRLLRRPASPLSRNAWFASITTVGNPACADTCAMPEPMSPQPMTPTCLMAMPEQPPWVFRGRRRVPAAELLAAAARQQPQIHHLVRNVARRARVLDGDADGGGVGAVTNRAIGHHLSVRGSHDLGQLGVPPQAFLHEGLGLVRGP